jgi:hypothetical protein
MKTLAAGMLLLLLVLPAWAQEGDLFDDDLFEDEDLIEDSVEQEEGSGEERAAPEEAFLVSEQLEWGGRFELELAADVLWDGYPLPWERRFWQEGNPALSSRLATDLFFDARPERTFRVFGKVKAAYQYPEDWEVEIFELFSDFQFQDLLFFRVGKQTVQWGVGYFFSPADVLNLVSIDAEDPEAEREGPIALKTQLPFGAHNAYLYLITNDIDEPYQIAVAPKVELLIGSYELGIGAFYQIDLTPKGMLTLTGPLRDLDLFAEAMIQWGSDRTYVRSAGAFPFYETYTIEDELLFSGTAGFSYINADWDLSLFAQYFFNGQGYEDGLPSAAGFAFDAGAISRADLLNPGRHYLAASIAWSELLDSDFSLSLLYLANLSDRSGLITPTVSWTPIDHVSLSTGPRITYGQAGSEYAPLGGGLAWRLTATLGSGRF